MCGRFVSASSPAVLASYFSVDVVEDVVAPSWNVAPTDRVYALVSEGGRRRLSSYRWGLDPSWAREASGGRYINARAESLTTQPVFRTAFARRHCIVPADGFYEWRTGPGGVKQPCYLRPRDGRPLALAGLWEPNGDRSFTIVTTRANHTVAPLHDRMPAILPADRWEAWLVPEGDQEAAALLGPAPDSLLSLVWVTPAVNSVSRNGPGLLQEAPTTLSLFEDGAGCP